MNTEREFLRKLTKAKTEDEKTWLTTKRLIDSLPEDLQTVVYSAAIPHWFDEKILRALNPELSRKIKRLYSQLKELPFVEKYENRGHNIHELTRRLLLMHLWKKQNVKYRSLSKNLVKFYKASLNSNVKIAEKKLIKHKEQNFSKKSIKELNRWINANPEIVNAISLASQNEYLYHLVIAQPKLGVDGIRRQFWIYHNSSIFSHAELSALIELIDEHIVSNRIKGSIIGWNKFFKGIIYFYKNDLNNATNCFLEVIKNEYPDKLLNADARFRLGHVYTKLSKTTKARRYFNDALLLYRAAKNKFGEANCKYSLGELHKSLSELSKAKAFFEQCLPLYHDIKKRSGEANSLYSLGEIHKSLSEFHKARVYFEEARDIYRDLKDKINEANCATIIGDIYAEFSELSEANLHYENAEAAYRQVIKLNRSDRVLAYYNLGFLLKKLKRYEEAEEAYRKSIEIDSSNSSRYVGLIDLFRFHTDKPGKALPLLEKQIEINPKDFEANLAIASISKQINKKLLKENIDKARQFLPKNDWYDLACLESICDNFDLAFEYLEKATHDNGFDSSWAWNDPDLQWIRDDPRFTKIVGAKPLL